MDDWNDFKYVLALHRGETMKQAAALLGADATTISRHIKRLSNDYGVVLFTRQKGATWRITNDGRRLLEVGLSIQKRVGDLKLWHTKGEQTTTLTITSLEFLLAHYLAPELASFTSENPDIRICLKGSDKRLSLAYGEADLALRFGRPTEGHLVASKVAEVPFEIWSRPGMNLRHWVGLDRDLDWTPEMQLGHIFFRKAPSIRVTSFAAARNASIALGYPFVGPSVMVRPHDGFKALQGSDVVNREIWSVIHETRRNSVPLSRAKEWVRSVFSGRSEGSVAKREGSLA